MDRSLNKNPSRSQSIPLLNLARDFSVWLKYVPGITFKTDNGPFRAEKYRFMTKIVNMMKEKRLFETQGGPIILSQIEKEYEPMEYEIGASGQAYTKWAAKWVVGLQAGVPWVMCKQDYAIDRVIRIEKLGEAQAEIKVLRLSERLQEKAVEKVDRVRLSYEEREQFVFGF